MIDVENNEN